MALVKISASASRNRYTTQRIAYTQFPRRRL